VWLILTVKHSAKPLLFSGITEFKAKKRVTISDDSIVDNSFEISNIGFTPRDILYTIKSINFILEIDFEK
jgi:hypothetical protein